MISLRNVSTHFAGKRGEDGFTAVDDVCLDVPAGSIQGVIGFSGAGKSTLLRNINLLERPTSGQVVVDGVDLTALDDEGLRRERHQLGMIFQHFNLLNNRTAQENVELSLKFAGVPKRERRERAAEALEIVDLGDRARSYPAKLSGGQKQRVAIARALATKPKVLLCDEPTSALDPRTTGSVLQYLADINQQLGITTVVVTHELDVVKNIVDDVAVMEAGRIAERFAVDDLRSGAFQPTTEIGRYLLDADLHIKRVPLAERRRHVAANSTAAKELAHV
ncbi:methionine ABC transporter ATP-binding protein [Zhihengliuella flava]|uniref:D-methionine transport system ATP-binding protein n=1 Tax=Zhihengliuella flava TaxID=1285193 RepID=A0A931GF95_9MICC|nr:ATP-binding cassette domain-containing protein [Zhihengliuella flava]MBG6084980.1 D-methionine transport system ATP-binding protein [Zhihengliuella flava]